MSTVGKGVQDLFNNYLQLTAEERVQFRALLGASPTGSSHHHRVPAALLRGRNGGGGGGPLLHKRGEGEVPHPLHTEETQSRYTELLYETLRRKVYAYRGIHILRLPSLRGTSAREELQAAWAWLVFGAHLPDLPLTAGLLEICADSVARCTPLWRPGMRARDICEALRKVPSVVDEAYPGYRHNRILHALARKLGAGGLPTVTNLQEED